MRKCLLVRISNFNILFAKKSPHLRVCLGQFGIEGPGSKWRRADCGIPGDGDWQGSIK